MKSTDYTLFTDLQEALEQVRGGSMAVGLAARVAGLAARVAEIEGRVDEIERASSRCVVAGPTCPQRRPMT